MSANDDTPTKEERIEGSDVDAEYCEADVASGDVDIPVALPAQRGDRVVVEYREDADIPQAGDTETFVYLGTRGEMVMFETEDLYDSAVERADDSDFVTMNGHTSEGAFRFNERLKKHAACVTVERKDTPEFLSVR